MRRPPRWGEVSGGGQGGPGERRPRGTAGLPGASRTHDTHPASIRPRKPLVLPPASLTLLFPTRHAVQKAGAAGLRPAHPCPGARGSPPQPARAPCPQDPWEMDGDAKPRRPGGRCPSLRKERAGESTNVRGFLKLLLLYRGRGHRLIKSHRFRAYDSIIRRLCLHCALATQSQVFCHRVFKPPFPLFTSPFPTDNH